MGSGVTWEDPWPPDISLGVVVSLHQISRRRHLVAADLAGENTEVLRESEGDEASAAAEEEVFGLEFCLPRSTNAFGRERRSVKFDVAVRGSPNTGDSALSDDASALRHLIQLFDGAVRESTNADDSNLFDALIQVYSTLPPSTSTLQRFCSREKQQRELDRIEVSAQNSWVGKDGAFSGEIRERR
ncbi:uncharacterized protein G2W53_007848 [Senna tora]|uniref:Uncharacterized protein n=1 Tax=Senna tora TaxID=362788 RepID=A0A835CE33_9FABA|nr:uncharacterized protein G2W53_007848 [Senna tora]